MASNFLKNESMKGLKVRELPKYVIFDKSGKMVNIDAPRPSQKETLIAEFEKYLKE